MSPASEGPAQDLWPLFQARQGQYPVRTRHRDRTGAPRYVNRLILSTSPYLLQHAHNPVDWWPWGEAAFAAAKAADRPLFLSIGYSTCHWCHVMEEESFDDPEVAEYLNRHFVAIKLDREILPDVDRYYMQAAMLFTGQGGWPMSSFLTLDSKPFFSGTYYPKQDFLQLLRTIQQYWQCDRQGLQAQADAVTQHLSRSPAFVGEPLSADGCVPQAVAQLTASFDAEYGGFGDHPKFPDEVKLLLLLEHALAAEDAEALHIVEHSLQGMAQGGLHDQIGGGFHRYATDRRWRLPHFEKMLYNQANLARLYLRAWELTGKTFYRDVACETLDYTLRSLGDPAGRGFYSATDADSEAQEGLFFAWTDAELRAALEEEDYAFAMRCFDFTALPHLPEARIPYVPVPWIQCARREGLSSHALHERLQALRVCLRQRRDKRTPPFRDDKIITAWNGMMIVALSAAARLCQRPQYLTAARSAARWLLQGHRQDNGQLWRISLHGTPSVPAQQEDYAALMEALLQLYDDTGESLWLSEAESISEHMIALFHDPEQGGFFMSHDRAAVDGATLPTRIKDSEDNATPSGNAMALRALGKLARRSTARPYRSWIHGVSGSVAHALKQWPHAHCYLLLGLMETEDRERASVQYAAAGRVRVSLHRSDARENGSVQGGILSIDLPTGFCLARSSGTPGFSLESATKQWTLVQVSCPDTSVDGRIMVRFTVRSRCTTGFAFPARLRLHLAVCQEAGVCLPDEVLELLLPPGNSTARTTGDPRDHG